MAQPLSMQKKCVVCKTHDVVANNRKISAPFHMGMVVGQESAGAQTQVWFYCSNPDCGVRYEHPPGVPDWEPYVRKLAQEHCEAPR